VTEHAAAAAAAAAAPPAGRPLHTANKLHHFCCCELGHVVHLLFVYFMFYFVFQNKIHMLRHVVDSCDKHRTGLLIIILITNLRQYLRRCRPNTDSVQALQGASCTPTMLCQSVCPVPCPSLLKTRRSTADAIIKRRRRPLRRYSTV